MSCQPHRVTSGQPDFVKSKCTFQNSSQMYIKPFSSQSTKSSGWCIWLITGKLWDNFCKLQRNQIPSESVGGNTKDKLKTLNNDPTLNCLFPVPFSFINIWNMQAQQMQSSNVLPDVVPCSKHQKISRVSSTLYQTEPCSQQVATPFILSDRRLRKQQTKGICLANSARRQQ